jgi:alpha-mannosidase
MCDGPKEEKTLVVEDRNIVLVAFKQSVDADRFVIRLMNNNRNAVETKLHIGGQAIELSFAGYEVKTILYGKDGFEESKELLI